MNADTPNSRDCLEMDKPVCSATFPAIAAIFSVDLAELARGGVFTPLTCPRTETFDLLINFTIAVGESGVFAVFLQFL